MSIIAKIEQLYKQGKTPAEITAALFPGAETTAYVERVIARLDSPAPAKKPRKPRRSSSRCKATFRADSVLSSFETQATRTGKAQAEMVDRVNAGRVICSWCGKDLGPAETELDSHSICDDCYRKQMEEYQNPPASPDSIAWHVAGRTIILPRDDDSGQGSPPAVQASFRLIPFTAAGRTSLLEVM